MDALKVDRERREVTKKAVDESWQDNDLVFASKVGTELDSHNVRRSFRTVLVLKKAGLNPLNGVPREMRHISLLSDSGMPIEAISRRSAIATPA
ncbi:MULTISPECIES: hypothetical protein [Nonomuraea]|uniref:Uncharacterized protein n=1 Tax=Nonomuraea ferruginea TaxID=46174 RepID=A0ABT4SU54_9ACTN|nr:hypothetical protein [Nonomuraea ferruginea]MDA0640570.1 hypothetical protein [Nonomuraea ferruginea]